MKELNTLLADLAGDGALDSENASFTVSLHAAEEKLAAYRLAIPGLFVLNLVAAAVAGGASKLRVETRDSTTKFDFDSDQSYQHEQLEGLFGYILKPSAPPYLRELALAVHGARSLPERPVISLEVASAEGSRRLLVRERDIAVLAGPERPPGVTLQLDYPPRSGWGSLFQSQDAPSAEALEHLFHYCRYAPLQMTYNGQSKQRAVKLTGQGEQGMYAWRHVKGQQHLIVVGGEGHYPREEADQKVPLSTMVVGLGGPKAASSRGLTLVSRGVAFQRPQELLGFPLACAVVSADHLEKNLSQSDLVEDAQYQALIEAVRAEVESLVLAVCASPPVWSAAATTFSRALQSHYREADRPLVVSTFLRLQEVSQRSYDPDAQARQMAYWRELAKQEPAHGETFRIELLAATRQHAGKRLAASDWEKAAFYLADVAELERRLPDALQVVAMVLAEQAEARGLLQPSTLGNSTVLEYLLDWRQELDEDSPRANFLRLQRAVHRKDLSTADRLASALGQLRGTAFLYLWLGWYELHRNRRQRTLELWEKALDQLPGEERVRWTDLLWPELSGKVSFLDQVRWQARRNFAAIFSNPSSRPSLHTALTIHPVRWVKSVWRAWIGGKNDEAYRLYVNGYLAAIIRPDELCLEPLDSPRIPLAPFRH